MKHLLLSIVLLVTACAPLSKHDSILGDTGEVLGRAVLCPLTLCFSEIGFYQKYKDEQRQEMYARWYQSLTPEQQAREDQRQHERSIAAMQALGYMQAHRPLFNLPPPAPVQSPAYNQQPAWRPKERTQCNSQVIGNQVYTNCY